jgi:hypothetical protein
MRLVGPPCRIARRGPNAVLRCAICIRPTPTCAEIAADVASRPCVRRLILHGRQQGRRLFLFASEPTFRRRPQERPRLSTRYRTTADRPQSVSDLRRPLGHRSAEQPSHGTLDYTRCLALALVEYCSKRLQSMIGELASSFPQFPLLLCFGDDDRRRAGFPVLLRGCGRPSRHRLPLGHTHWPAWPA